MAIFKPDFHGFKSTTTSLHVSSAFDFKLSNHSLPGVNSISIPKNTTPLHLDLGTHFSSASNHVGLNIPTLPTTTHTQVNPSTPIAKLTVTDLQNGNRPPAVINTNNKVLDPNRTITLGEDIQLRHRLAADPTRPYATAFANGVAGAATELNHRVTNYLVNEAPTVLRNSLGASPMQLVLGFSHNQATKISGAIDNFSMPNIDLANINWASVGQNAVHFIKNPNGLARTAGALAFESLIPTPSNKIKMFGDAAGDFFKTLTPNYNHAHAGVNGSIDVHYMTTEPGKGTRKGGMEPTKNSQKPTPEVALKALTKTTHTVFDEGPNRWIKTGNNADGVLVQRGLTGDYAAGNGFHELQGILKGDYAKTQTVSHVGDEKNIGQLTSEVTSIYNDPFAIQARLPKSALGDGRTDREFHTTRPIAAEEINAMGSFIPDTSDIDSRYKWARAYLTTQQKLGVTPTPGSRGDRFTSELKQTINSTARYGEPNEFGRPLLNSNEVALAVDRVLKRFEND